MRFGQQVAGRACLAAVVSRLTSRPPDEDRASDHQTQGKPALLTVRQATHAGRILDIGHADRLSSGGSANSRSPAVAQHGR